MKKKINAKIPKLHGKTTAFLAEIEQPRYLDMTDDIDDVLLDVQKFDHVCDQILEKRDSIQEYQRTLDMGEITQFLDVEEAKRKYTYRAKLWKALNDWTNLTRKWEVACFEDIDVDNI